LNVCREFTADTAEYFHPAHLQLKYDELKTSQRQDSRPGVFILASDFLITWEQSIINMETVYYKN